MEKTAKAAWPLAIACGVAAAVVVMLALSLPAAAIIYFGPWGEGGLPAIAIVISVLAIGAGGWVAGRRVNARGLLLGLAVAGLTILLALLIGPAGGSLSVWQLICSVLAGMVGGVLGVR